MRKQVLLAIALFWTGIVAYFCLVQSKDVPVINIPNLDKFAHAIFHFVFTLVWFLFFNKELSNKNSSKALVVSFILSFSFGIGIEILQKTCTTTRNANIYDVLANIAGAVLAIATIVFLGLNKNRNKIQ